MASFKAYPVIILFIVVALAIVRPSNQLSPLGVLWHVHVVNGLSNNKVLFVHCKSADDDLGPRNLTVGAETKWRFKMNFFGSTLFFCYATPRTEQIHARFDVFWEDNEIYYKCNLSDCIWITKDDGIYLKNIPENKDEFKYEWRLGRMNSYKLEYN